MLGRPAKDLPLIAFDATPLEVRHRAGVSHSVAHLLGALVERDDDIRYALLASRGLTGQVPAGTLGEIGPRFPNRWLWMQLVVPLIVRRLQPELCHFTNSLAPLAVPSPFVVQFHDMLLFLLAKTQPKKSLLLVRTIMPALARKASAIITPSESAKRDVVSVLKVPSSKVHAIYEAAAPRYGVIGDRAVLDRARRRYGLTDPYVLFVGTLEPRKNLRRLLEAFGRVRRAGRLEQLILVGQLGWKYRRLLREIEACGLGSVVRLLGYVPDDDLPALYNLARLVAFPSLYEGFGLPILEGMACGVPVLTSDCASMTELSGDAAVLVDPTDADALAAGLLRVLEDPTLRSELAERGRVRAAEFSWARTAEETVRVYDTVRGRSWSHERDR